MRLADINRIMNSSFVTLFDPVTPKTALISIAAIAVSFL